MEGNTGDTLPGHLSGQLKEVVNILSSNKFETIHFTLMKDAKPTQKQMNQIQMKI